MKVSDLSLDELRQRLRRGRLALDIGPFGVSAQSPIDQVARNLHRLYADYPLSADGRASDFHVALRHPTLLRRLIRPQVDFLADGHAPFKPLPANQAFALFEWGLNWCVATQAHHYLMLHAAVVARGDRAVILPGDPGAGKSTLTAALVNRGWRLLSDEMTLLDPDTLAVQPIPRPVSLKNASIHAIRRFAPDTVFGDVAHDTAKGTVSHMRPPAESVRHARDTAIPAAVVFPRYQAGVDLSADPVQRHQVLMRVAENAFNHHIHHEAGFDALRRLAACAPGVAMTYSALDDAVAWADNLFAGGVA